MSEFKGGDGRYELTPEPKFNPGRIPAPRNPEMERYVEGAWANNPEAAAAKQNLLDILNSDNFDRAEFDQAFEAYNQAHAAEFTGQTFGLGDMNAKHGRLKAYHYRETKGIKFGYDNIK